LNEFLEGERGKGSWRRKRQGGKESESNKGAKAQWSSLLMPCCPCCRHQCCYYRCNNHWMLSLILAQSSLVNLQSTGSCHFIRTLSLFFILICCFCSPSSDCLRDPNNWSRPDKIASSTVPQHKRETVGLQANFEESPALMTFLFNLCNDHHILLIFVHTPSKSFCFLLWRIIMNRQSTIREGGMRMMHCYFLEPYRSDANSFLLPLFLLSLSFSLFIIYTCSSCSLLWARIGAVALLIFLYLGDILVSHSLSPSYLIFHPLLHRSIDSKLRLFFICNSVF
jgi:hypothetical protein